MTSNLKNMEKLFRLILPGIAVLACIICAIINAIMMDFKYAILLLGIAVLLYYVFGLKVTYNKNEDIN